ncbi:MAG: UDP-N-acetylmuramoyl-L-alanyl-D-glutamate--2,6-diaminopimelate ligase [Azospirillaceae bacterium]|nr:UDP-N-acetylmuramoyl-L-alanyl-D-glutamate--2,6-diaminopimelate ligase [Azospirillaceae bacterium]
MRLHDLTARPGPADRDLSDGPDPEIAGLSADSRTVAPGFLFAALPGTRIDGRTFIPDAIARGARVILAAPGTSLPAPAAGTAPVTLITDDNPRLSFARIAARFFPAQPATIAAVTGTNGKTSTVQFCRQLWAALGCQAGALGTLGVTAPGLDHYGAWTTPDPVILHQTLAELSAHGIDHLAMEASSHGLDQFRLDGVRIQVAGFTNLSRDHLDYHGDMDAYFTAKAALFDRILPSGGSAVLNADVPEFTRLRAIAMRRGQQVIDYGAQGEALAVDAVTPDSHGQRLTLRVFGRPYDLRLPLAGRFQAWNVLCAIGLAIGSGSEPERVIEAAAHLDGVRGRLEHVARHPDGAPIYVDFAHTPDALEKVLQALRPHVTRDLSVVFGCGGDRDRGKRPVMGTLAQTLADRVIVTDDNPRTEDPASVRAQVMAGCPEAREIGDRHAAIRQAVRELGAGDVLVIAGKGHEQGQIVGSEIRPFDDADEARRAVAAIIAERGAS